MSAIIQFVWVATKSDMVTHFNCCLLHKKKQQYYIAKQTFEMGNNVITLRTAYSNDNTIFIF